METKCYSNMKLGKQARLCQQRDHSVDFRDVLKNVCNKYTPCSFLALITIIDGIQDLLPQNIVLW